MYYGINHAHPVGDIVSPAPPPVNSNQIPELTNCVTTTFLPFQPPSHNISLFLSGHWS